MKQQSVVPASMPGSDLNLVQPAAGATAAATDREQEVSASRSKSSALRIRYIRPTLQLITEPNSTGAYIDERHSFFDSGGGPPLPV